MSTRLLSLTALAIALVIGFPAPPNAEDIAGGQAPGTATSHPLDPIIDNGAIVHSGGRPGTVQLGINPEGHLNVPGGTASMPSSPTTIVGLRYLPTNGEATAPGCLCEGWGVANADPETGTFAGYANIFADGGAVGLVLQPGTEITDTSGDIRAESVGSAFRSVVTAGGGRVRVTHSFHASPSPNLYQVDVTIENIGATDIGDLRYRRVMDWDIAPFTFSEWVEIHVGSAANVLRATTDGFASANPLSILSPGAGSPPTTLLPGAPDYFAGPSDQGALFDFGFGPLASGATRRFRIYYGAAGTRADALAALSAVGAEVYSLGLPRQSNNTAAVNGPHAFIFAFSGVGGATVVNSPPVADAKAVTTAQDTDVPITLSGSDAETDPANFAWSVGTPAHGSLLGTAPNLTYRPAAGYSGPDSFTYTVTDRGSPDNCGATGATCAGPLTSEPATVSITVNGGGNHAPTASVSVTPLSPGTSDVITATATKGDVDENPVSLTFVWKKTTGETTTTLRTFTTSAGLTDTLDLAVAGNGDRGDVISVDVIPNDGVVDGAAASASVVVVNSPPALTVGDQAGTEGVSLSFQVTASDPDGSDAVTLSAGNLPPGASFNTATGAFSWTPSFAQGGPNPYFVQFTASDGQTSTTKTIAIAISDVTGRPDRDGDGVPDDVDNCPDDPNPTQADFCHNSKQPTTGASSAGAPGSVAGLPIVTYNLTVTAIGGATSWPTPDFLTGTLHCHIIDTATGEEVPAERVPEIPAQVMDEDGGILIRVPAGATRTLTGHYDPGLTHPDLAPGVYEVVCEYRNLTPRPDPQPGDPPVWIGETAATTTTLVVGGTAQGFFLHGDGATVNPPALFLNHAVPVGPVAKSQDSAPVNFSGGNPWREVGTWTAPPAVLSGEIAGFGPLQVWLGLVNSDDQGTFFDVQAELLMNGATVASGLTRCVKGITRDPSAAKQATVSFGGLAQPLTFNGTTDSLAVRVSARIGTTASGTRCVGSHASALGLRLYFDAPNREAQFSTNP